MPGKFFLPPISGYDQFEVVSALRKTIKLGDVRAAIYWLNVLIENGHTRKAARNLWIMAAEDIDEPMVVLRAFAVFNLISKVPETDHLYFLTRAMCDAPNLEQRQTPERLLVGLAAAMSTARKWWEHEDGREVDDAWSQAIGDLKDPARRREVPLVALDQHTRRGKALANKPGEEMRDELSGTDKGRMKTTWQFLANGVLDEFVRVLDSEPGFRDLYNRQQELQGNRRPFPTPKPDEPPPDDLFGGELPREEPPRRMGYWNGCENWREWA